MQTINLALGQGVVADAGRGLKCIHTPHQMRSSAPKAPEEGRVPPGPMPNEPTPGVAWLPMKAWARRNPAL
ncbi:hypothetical protein [Thermoproteus tenax]|uniref:Uncharacterized protein n=1 Tax=Thermoproteus tenax (strain ATCC 35583 / DSM 2078 / JCM 9277 / NBRC 100435 / Kra 1) TaxID=768679 RepID=G4RJS3_THETK|nr:hypothetical protein [Thermoproteus tenax]CCC81818.1 hypothetical protein TTX_1177 [Thermoproteus tenax Kra 1]